MSDEIERQLVQVRADTTGFARDVAEMRGLLDGPLQAGAARAGQAIEATLVRSLKTGKLGFDELRKTALAVLADIAAAALKGGIAGLFGQKSAGGTGAGLGSLLGSLIGAPGRATGGPVSPARPYWVGERGPELFVPTASGRVEAAGVGAVRTVNVAIRVQADAGTAPEALRQSSRQVARAVRAAIEGAE